MSTVYFMRRADGVGPIKIGCSKWPEKRLRSFQSWAPEKLEIIAATEGTFADERRLHREFDSVRVHGEWFEATPQLLSCVARICATGKLPPAKASDRTVRILAMEAQGMTLQEIGDEFGVSRQRIDQILRKNGVKKREARGRKKGPIWGKVEQIRSLASSGCTYREIAKAIGEDYSAVVRVANSQEINVIRAKKGHSEETSRKAFEAAAMYKAGRKTATIAKKIGCPQPNIYKLLAIAGVKASRRPDTRGLQIANIDKATAAYTGGATLEEAAAMTDATPYRVRNHLSRSGLLRSKAENEKIRVVRVAAANKRRAA